MKFRRYLAPTAAPLSCGDVLWAVAGLLRGPRGRAQVEVEIRQFFGVKHVFLLSSGKAALSTIIRALKTASSRRKVVIPAYTCFSVPSAIVRAGGQVVLCDVDPHTLDFDFVNLQRIVDNDTLCIISPHFLGQAADIPRAKAIAKLHEVPVIEDAAQAMGRKTQDGWVGTSGDVGFFSLGRGKNITAGSGGVIVTNSDEVADKLSNVYAEVPEESLASQVVNGIMVCAMTILIRPRAYWLPAGLPFLGLGETIFQPGFPIRRLDGLRAGLLKTWRQRLETSNQDRVRNAGRYLSSLHDGGERLEPVRMPGIAYLRLPVVMPTVEMRQEFCTVGKEQGLGVSALYPSPISKIPELKDKFEGQHYPGAEVLADRLVTLPVHHYVEGRDIARICEMLHRIVDNRRHSSVDGLRRLAERSVSPSEVREVKVSSTGQ
ncbi:MAG: DegT/DnrJ/EryC1/StrS aminotransferase family protein [Nitrospira sp.]|nr:DegT/DnrJ/EryC1/StrS aminotransferase family protein [Nitrospira sp.]